MKKMKIGLALIGVIFVTITWESVAPSPAEVHIHVGIGIPLPPPLVIPVPPPMTPIPGPMSTSLRPSMSNSVFRRVLVSALPRPASSRARSYNGPWVFMEPYRVPRAVISLPPDYRHIPPGHRPISYGQF